MSEIFQIFKKGGLKNFFEKNFSFESNIDLSDEFEVLYKRNIVIKNIILVSNLVYSLLLFLVTFGTDEPGSWLFSIIPLPITFLINKSIKSLIYNEKQQIATQQIAMYMSSFYMFLSALIIYVKLSLTHSTEGVDFSVAGYMLIYYSLIVVSLYQDRNMLKRVFLWVLGMVTVLHITITYNLYGYDYSEDVFIFLQKFFFTDVFKDIFLRTAILCCFMLVVYSICVIGEKMGAARNQELSKRQEIQEDFTQIVTNLFDVLLNSRTENNNNPELLANMTKRLASTYGFQPSKCTELAEYAMFLNQNQHDFNLNQSTNSNEELFEVLRKQSKLGTQLVKRIELEQKTINIVRAHIEGNDSGHFVNSMNKIQKNIEAEIILLADIYITLRSPQSYKRPYHHTATIEYITSKFSCYFDSNLLERFLKFQSDFEKIYDYE